MTRGPDGEEPLVVVGGSDGVAAVLTEVDAAGRTLGEVARRLAGLAADVSRLAASPDLLAAGVFAPLGAARVHAELLTLAGPTGLLGAATQTEGLGVAVRAATTAYRKAERAAEALINGADHLAGYLLGRYVGTAIIAGVALSTPSALIAGAATLAHPSTRHLTLTAFRQRSEIGGRLSEQAGTSLDRWLFDHPWLTDHAAESLDGLILGVGDGVAPIGWWLRWRSLRAGTPYPPHSQEEALQVVLAIAAGTALDEGGRGIRVKPRRVVGASAPQDLADLVADDGRASGGRDVRVIGVPQADGSWGWIVDIPGTQDFTPFAGDNPWDSTSNVRLEAGLTTATMAGVERALSDAKSRVGGPADARRRDRVLLSGHSQGGITAAALAAQPEFRARHAGLRHIITSGAPIGRSGLPPEIHVLSLEHEQDLVPRLDGEDNPDRPNWVTVRRDLADELGQHGRSTGAHDGSRYGETAALAEHQQHPSVATWLAEIEPFLDREGTREGVVVVDYRLAREPP